MTPIARPQAGDDVRKLWRTVAECIDRVNAIANMTVIVAGQTNMIGKLDVGASQSTITIKQPNAGSSE